MITEAPDRTKQFVETTLSGLAGRPVELTIRGASEFTISCDGECDLLSAARQLFGAANLTDVLVEYSAEFDLTLVYFDLPSGSVEA